jgi:predicted XRE-type DNA-binding protein
MSKKRFANVWDAIEDTPAQAENMKLRSALIIALKDHIARTGLSQSQAANCLVLRSHVSLISCAARSNCLASIPWSI